MVPDCDACWLCSCWSFIFMTSTTAVRRQIKLFNLMHFVHLDSYIYRERETANVSKITLFHSMFFLKGRLNFLNLFCKEVNFALKELFAILYILKRWTNSKIYLVMFSNLKNYNYYTDVQNSGLPSPRNNLFRHPLTHDPHHSVFQAHTSARKQLRKQPIWD